MLIACSKDIDLSYFYIECSVTSISSALLNLYLFQLEMILYSCYVPSIIIIYSLNKFRIIIEVEHVSVVLSLSDGIKSQFLLKIDFSSIERNVLKKFYSRVLIMDSHIVNTSATYSYIDSVWRRLNITNYDSKCNTFEYERVGNLG